jgi:hypothetical protein
VEIITYALRGDDRTGSDQYYRDVAAFTDEVLVQGEHLTAPLVSAYRIYRQSLGWVPDCTAMEQTLEVLTLGTLWRVYGDAALELPALPGQLLAGLGDLRRQGGALKPGVDFLRGVLATLFLTPEDEDGTAGYPDPTADHLERLLDWLDATGEFPMEVRHLRPWWEYLAACEPRTAR